jgi:chaperonin cofactor prefoldin
VSYPVSEGLSLEGQFELELLDKDEAASIIQKSVFEALQRPAPSQQSVSEQDLQVQLDIARTEIASLQRQLDDKNAEIRSLQSQLSNAVPSSAPTSASSSGSKKQGSALKTMQRDLINPSIKRYVTTVPGL